MKSKILAVIALTFFFCVSFAQAETVASPIKIVAVAMHKGMAALQIYGHNKNYHTMTQKVFLGTVCKNNPKHFKKCTEEEYRNIRAETILYFPALPEAKDKTILAVWKGNEIYRDLFKTLKDFKAEVGKNNSEVSPEVITKSVGLKITDRPETYIVLGDTKKVPDDSITVDKKTFVKAENGGYYRPASQIIPDQNKTETKKMS